MKSTFFLIFITPFLLFSQTGPGGVGTNDGTSDLVLWLNVNAETTGINGAALTTWNDHSGNNHDFLAGTVGAGNGGTYHSSSVNNYPSLSFNGTNDYYERAFTPELNSNSFTIFSVSNVTSSTSYKSLMTSREVLSGSRRGYMLYSRPATSNWDFWTGVGTNWGTDGNNTSTAGTWAGLIWEYAPGTNNKNLFIKQSLDNQTTRSMLPNTSNFARVGAGGNNATPQYYFKGNIAEVVFYNSILNSAQKIIIDNYLAAKYNYLLTANDIYSKDNSSAGEYDHDVAGIGRIDATNNHDDSQGTGVIRILNPTNLDDNEFLFWGHDNGVMQALETGDVPAGVVARLERVWRVSERNTSNTSNINVGNIDMRWDLTDLGTVSASDLRLLIDTDNDGNFSDETPINGATSLGSNIYEFSSVPGGSNGITDSRRFTLGTINQIQTPLPIELIDFEAYVINNEFVKLDWSTASETNNDYFSIQRSDDGITFENIGKIDGAGFSNDQLNYTFNDRQPKSGILYYRIKQVDFDGKLSYSKTKTAEIEWSNFKLFPNPANEKLFILGKKINKNHLKIYNVLGENVTAKATVQSIDNTLLELDLSNFSTGLYIVKLNGFVHKFYRR